MSRVKYTAPIAEQSGTVGGVTYARCHYGKTARLWRAPCNKRSTSQITRRTQLSIASAAWFTDLDAAQRADWNAYALTCEFTDALGDPYYLSGFNIFVRNQILIAYFGWGSYLDAPTFPGHASAPAADLIVLAADGIVTLDDLVPAPDASDMFGWTLFRWRRCTRTKGLTIFAGRKTHSGAAVLPYELFDIFGVLPGSAGDHLVELHWYVQDTETRISTKQTALVLST